MSTAPSPAMPDPRQPMSADRCAHRFNAGVSCGMREGDPVHDLSVGSWAGVRTHAFVPPSPAEPTREPERNRPDCGECGRPLTASPYDEFRWRCERLGCVAWNQWVDGPLHDGYDALEPVTVGAETAEPESPALCKYCGGVKIDGKWEHIATCVNAASSAPPEPTTRGEPDEINSSYIASAREHLGYSVDVARDGFSDEGLRAAILAVRQYSPGAYHAALNVAEHRLSELSRLRTSHAALVEAATRVSKAKARVERIRLSDSFSFTDMLAYDDLDAADDALRAALPSEQTQ